MIKTLGALLSARTARIAVALLSMSALGFGGFFVSSAFAGTPSTSVVINEFSSYSSSDWVELYNPSSSSVDVSGWKLYDTSTTAMAKIGDGTSIPAGGFLVVQVSNRLNKPGDVITLKNGNGTTVDSVAYGNASGAVVSAPGSGQSAGRVPDGAATWQLLAPTPDSSNAPITDTTHLSYYQTIGAALQNASSSDTLVVSPGTYTLSGVQNITKPVTLLGPNAAINPNTGTTVSAATINGQLLVEASNVTIKGFTISDPKYSGSSVKGIQIYNTDPTPLTNIDIENNIFGNITNSDTHGAYGVMVQGNEKGVTVSNNKLDGITSAGWAHAIEVTPSCGSTASPQNVTVDNNVFGNIKGDNGDSFAFSADACDPSNVTNAKEITLKGNQFNGAGVRNLDTKHVLYAVKNWWNNKTGPTDTNATDHSVPAENPNGTGTPAMGRVVYSGWCTDATCTTFEPLQAPTNLYFGQDGNKPIACNSATNSKDSASLYWTPPTPAPYQYVVTRKFPGQATTTHQMNGSNTQLWIGAHFPQNGEGAYTYSIATRNVKYGPLSSSTPLCTFYYDTTRPTIAFNTPSTASTTQSGTFPVSVTAKDSGSGVKNIVVHLYNETTGKYLSACGKGFATTTLGVSTMTYKCNVDASSLNNGDYKFKAGVFDQAGNNDTISLPFMVNHSLPGIPTNLRAKFKYDSSFITSSSTLNVTGEPKGNDLELLWTAPSGQVTGYHILASYPDGSKKLIYQGSNTNAWLKKFDGFGAHGNGAYTYRVVAVNPNGVSAPSAPFTLIYDTQSPKAHFDPTPPEYVNGNFTVSGVASDNVRLKSVGFDVRDPSLPKGTNHWVTSCVGGTASTTYSANRAHATTTCEINTSKLTEGHQYILRIHVGDYSNYGGGQQQPLILDTTKPMVTMSTPDQGATVTGTITATGTAMDAISGIDHVAYTVNQINAIGGSHLANGPHGTASYDSSTNTWSFTASGLANGFYRVKVEAIDKAGNHKYVYHDVQVVNPGPTYVTTNAATNITKSDATLNGTNGSQNAQGHSFWVSTSTIDTSSPNIPKGVYSTTDLGSINAGVTFSKLLSSLTTNAYVYGQKAGTMPAVTPDTTYYYVAWSHVNGTWYPGAQQSFTTAPKAPVITSPTNDSTTTSADLKQVTWTAVGGAGTTYEYQASQTMATTTDGSFTGKPFVKNGLTTNSIPTSGTGQGTYYLHVKAQDNGVWSAWSPIVKVVVDNSYKPPVTVATTTNAVTVTQNDLATLPAGVNAGKWFFLNDTDNSIISNLGTFVKGPGTPPLGTGSVGFATPKGARYAIATMQFAGTPLKDITKLGYSTYRVSGSSALDYSLQFDINTNGTSKPSSYEGRLVYEPYFTHTVQTGAWQTWNTLDNATTNSGLEGNWWLSHSGVATNGCTQSQPCTWHQLLQKYPNMGITGATLLKTGAWTNSDFVGNVDAFTIGITNGANGTLDTFNFDPAPLAYGGAGGSGGSGGGSCTLAAKGDLNCDGKINWQDLAIFMMQYGKSGSNLSADLNHNGHVGDGDLAILLSNWTL